ncbi:MAG: cupin domain-containing protein [Deltaproteobacteria bacterium]|nr:cupin domain-containing protein [Deltaproteobacteria bacterium]
MLPRIKSHEHDLHVHPDQEEVIFVLSGKGTTHWEGGKQEVGPGCVIFIPAGEAHANVNSSDTEPLRVI